MVLVGIYSISAEWKTKQFLFVCSSTEFKACHTHFDSNNLPFSNKFFGMCFAQRTKKISMLIIKLFLFSGECNDFKNACNNFDADQYITSTHCGIEDAEFLPDKTQYLSLICLVLEAKFIFSKLDSLIESMQCINLSELN